MKRMMNENSQLQLLRNLINNQTMKYVTVVGKSMLPILIPNEKVYISPYNINIDLSIGKIIIFFKDNKLIIHRIIKVGKEYVITKGDNSPCDDGIIFKNMILAVADYRKVNLIDRLNLFIYYLKKHKLKKAFSIITHGKYNI